MTGGVERGGWRMDGARNGYGMVLLVFIYLWLVGSFATRIWWILVFVGIFRQQRISHAPSKSILHVYTSIWTKSPPLNFQGPPSPLPASSASNTRDGLEQTTLSHTIFPHSIPIPFPQIPQPLFTYHPTPNLPASPTPKPPIAPTRFSDRKN